MKIAICVKEVPDPTANKRIDPGTNRLVRSGENTLNPYDRHAIEDAVRIKEAGQETEIAIVLMGPASASRTVDKALAQGGDRSVHLADDGLAGTDVVGTSKALAALLRARRVRPRAVRPAGFRRRVLRDGVGRRRAPRAAVRDAGREPRPVDGLAAREAPDRDGLRHGRGADARRRVGVRRDQRAALPVAARHHGRQAQAARGARRWPTPASTPGPSARRSRTKVDGLSTPPARGDSMKIEDDGDRGREDPGLPRRAQGGRLMAGILVLCGAPGRRVLEGLAGPDRGGRAARCGAVRARPRAGLRRRRRHHGRRARQPRRQRRARRRRRRRTAWRSPSSTPSPRCRRRSRSATCCSAPRSSRPTRPPASPSGSTRAWSSTPSSCTTRAASSSRGAPASATRCSRTAGSRRPSAWSSCGPTRSPRPTSRPGSGGAEVRRFTPELRSFSTPRASSGTSRPTRRASTSGEADVLVGGGRGLGKPENFSALRGPRRALGGAVAATRAVVDAGWYPYATQVGQTGKSVSPKCYIAVGISGAIQHKVGMQSRR